MITSIDHVVLTTTRPEACIDFYTRILGMRMEVFVDTDPPRERRAFHFGNQKINVHRWGHEFEPKAHTPVPGGLAACTAASTAAAASAFIRARKPAAKSEDIAAKSRAASVGFIAS